MGTRMSVFAAASMLVATAGAQTLTGVAVAPGQIKPGESVKVTVNFDVEGPINCGLRLHFGDGNSVDYKINQQRDVPLVVPRAYASAGEFRIMAEPKTVGTTLRCGGKNQAATVRVVAPAAAAPSADKAAKTAKPAKTAKAAPQCPSGWTLDKKSVKKSGAYTCRAPGGTPAVKLACPSDLSYFENEKKGLMGCRP